MYALAVNSPASVSVQGFVTARASAAVYANATAHTDAHVTDNHIVHATLSGTVFVCPVHHGLSSKYGFLFRWVVVRPS